MSGLVEWIIFLALSAVAVLMAAGMLVTMSMYRAGLALMSSFVALAGLFILLDADLMAAIQVMMNVGGMLVMVLFMVMLMIDPGGEMMWDMKRKMRLPGPGAFSMSMPREAPPELDWQPEPATTGTASDWTCPMHPEVSAPGPGDCPICGMPLVQRSALHADHPGTAQATTYTCPMHPEVRQDHPGECPICGMDLVPTHPEQPVPAHTEHATTYTCPMHPEVRQPNPGQCPICGMDLVPVTETDHRLDGHDGQQTQAAMAMGHGEHEDGTGAARMAPKQHYEMMVGMAMSTAQLPWALAIGAATALLLVVLVLRTAWPLSASGPTQDATSMVGELLLSRYMIGFEGAAFLIVGGIAGAVIFGKREPHLVRTRDTATASAEATTYTCPMHPEVRQPGPGQCPICGMDLVPSEEVPQPAPAPTAQATTYTCPMHPEVRQDRPGQCPKCGMDLVPAAAEPAPAGSEQHGGHP